MKTRQLILIGTVLAISALSLPFIISETAPKPEIPKTPNLELMDKLVELGCTEPAINHAFRYSNLLDDSFDGTYFIDAIGYPDDLSKVEFDKCVSLILEIRIISNGVLDLNPKPEPNTIIIYDMTENGKTRLSITPHTLVMNLTDGNIIRFVNDGSTPVNIFDKAKGIWRFDDVKPSSQRILTINSTGFYEVLIQNSREGESGRIVVLDNDVNSLSVSDRIKMGKAIISGDFRKYPELVSVGAGSAEIGVHVTINKKELELHEDAKSYYHEKFSKIVPFEVPIVIEFGEPIEPE